MEEIRRGVPTWQDELASLMDGGLQYDGSPIDLTTDTESRSKSSGFGSGSGSESVESLKDQVMGFMKSWGEMLMDLAIGCKDVVQQMVVTEDSFVVRKLRKPAAKVSKKLSFLNEYLPEDRDPVHAWPVIFFVFLLALTVCLDGSLPGYHIHEGSGSGSKSWLVHLEGGGWCNTVASCSARAMTKLGSSNYFEHEVDFQGVLSSDPSQNPEFFNWNRVAIRYCDGASFAGHPEAEFKNETRLFFRGQLIWEAIIDELLSMGMSDTKRAILTGCSAGGLASLIHCDYFRDHLPKDAAVKCVSDGGFFLNVPDVLGNPTMESFYHDVVSLQGVDKSLEQKCVAKMERSKCMFPHEFLKHIKTPVFLVNPAYDFWQIQNVLVPTSADPDKSWAKCRLNIKECDAAQMKVLHGFRSSLMDAIGKFHQNKDGGMFIDSCYAHCQTVMSVTWHSPTSPRIENKTIAESVGDWYFNRKPVKLIDCPYPCNPSCYNLNFT